MEVVKIVILYRNGEKESSYFSDYGVSDDCLMLYIKNKETRYIPLDSIKEWRVAD